jgi:hypothetical protein
MSLPADIRDPVKKKEVLTLLLNNCDKKLAELKDRREILVHELSILEG